MKLPRALSLAALLLTLATSLALAWMARNTPVEPGWARGLLRADGLSALLGLCTAALALADAAAGRPAGRLALAAALLAAGYLTTHMALLGAALLGAALLLGWRRPAGVAAAAAAAAGLALIALQAGAWRYPAPAAGLGLNSLSFALLLAGALLAAGAPALPLARPGAPPAPFEPVLAAGGLYALLRLFALGPWNIGWLYAAMLLGAGAALWAAGRAAFGPPAHAGAWLSRFYLGLGLAGAGLASGAGVALAAFALIALAALRLALAQEAGGRRQEAGGRWQEAAGQEAAGQEHAPPGASEGAVTARGVGRPLWLLAGALPFSAPFTAAWAGVAGALAGGLSLLGVALWAAALLAALPVARAAEGSADDAAAFAAGRRLWLAAGLSLAAGVAAPALAWLLIEPAVGQLQAGLTPFGELPLWPWAGLIALDSARQPVATLPSLALAALMLVLGALAWAVGRLLALRGAPPERQD